MSRIAAIFFITLNSLYTFAAPSISPAQAKVYREKFVSEAKQHVGAPYVYGAIGPDKFDCSGLIYYCAREGANFQLPRTAKALYSYCRIVKDQNREVGDLLFFKTTSSGTVSHVGIYIGNSQFISAISDGPNTGVIISSLKQDYWKGKYIGAGQFLPSGKSAYDDEDDIEESIAVLDKKTSPKKSGRQSLSTKPSSAGTVTVGGSSFYNPEGSWKDTIIFDASISAGWSFLTPRRFYFMWRGIDTTMNARISKWVLEPGLGISFRYNAGVNAFQIPLFLSLTLNDYVRFFAGPVFTCGIPTMVDQIKFTQASIFPGIIGLSFSTPALDIGKTKLQIVQDISYTVFNNLDGAALSFVESVSAGIVFHSGVRITLPLGAFF